MSPRMRRLACGGTAVGLFLVFFALLSVTPEMWVDHPGLKADSLRWRTSTALADTTLVLLAATLVYGPLRTWRGALRVPHLPWRRTLALTAASTAMAHVVIGLGVHGEVLRPWRSLIDERPSLNNPIPFIGGWLGWANAGGFATLLVLAPLVITSNRVALVRLRPRRWKAIQRLSYVVLVLVTAHFVFYQQVEQRLIGHRVLTLSVPLVVATAQLAGWLTVRRNQRRSRLGRPV